MRAKKKRIWIINGAAGLLSVAVFVLGFFLYAAFVNMGGVIAEEESGVYFTEDVILNLDELDVTLYIAAESQMESLDVSGADADFWGVEDIHLKTDEHKVLEISSVSGELDLHISGTDVSEEGHLLDWEMETSQEETVTLGVDEPESYYEVYRNGEQIQGSPFLSNLSSEINFTVLQGGTYGVLLLEEYIEEECMENDIQGWAWSDNVGWVSFSCENQYEIGEGVNYGVNVDETTGVFSGYAWSENIGWISFNEGDLQGCPEGECVAKLVSDASKVTGWAKVISNNEWISLSGDIYGEGEEEGDKVGEYGVELVGSEFHGWAFGDKTVGWLSFNCVNTNDCDAYDYRVFFERMTIVTERGEVFWPDITGVDVELSEGNEWQLTTESLDDKFARVISISFDDEGCKVTSRVIWDPPRGEQDIASITEHLTSWREPFIIEHVLNVSSSSGGSIITPQESETVHEHGAEVEIAASSDSGYSFVQWTGDIGSIETPGSASTTITMDGSYSIVAEFEESGEENGEENGED